MKRLALILLLFVIMLGGMATVFPISQPLASIEGVGSYGGRIITIVNCDNPFRKFITLGFPTPGSYIYTPPAVHLSGPPSHLGQWVLGFSMGIDECFVGEIAVEGRKIFLLFGTSL